MYDILSLFSVLYPHLSTTTVRQFSRVVLGLLAMTGQGTMLNMSRWMSEGGSYRTVQRFFQHRYPLGGLFIGCFLERICWIVKVPISWLATKQSCQNRVNRRMVYRVFFSSGHGKTIPSLAFLSLSLVSVKERRCYPMLMEQIVRGDTCSPGPPETSQPRDTTQTPVPKRKRGASQGKSQPETRRRWNSAIP